MSKRLILFGPLPPPTGGVSVFLSSLWSHLKTHRVELWAIFGKETDDPRVTRFNHRRLGVVGALAQLGRNARIVDFTQFHLEYPNPILLPFWVVAKAVLRFEWYKYVLDGSLPGRYLDFNIVQRSLFRLACSAVDEFIVVSEQLRNWLINEVHVRQRITIIPCLLNIPSETLHADLAQSSEISLAPYFKRSHRVCSVGTFIPSYGFEHVVNAVEKIRNETNEDVGLLLLDGAFANEEAYRQRVLSGREWITVIQNLPNPEVYTVLRRCNLFVRAFADESYGISRVEAIWCGVPVIATNVGETRGMQSYEFGDEPKLVELIKRTLFEGGQDLGNWSPLFHEEASQNLNRFVETVGLEPES